MNKKKTLMVFTPTYNRAYCLGNCYESLKKQNCTDFVWLIIDDGSTDNTSELVNTWINECNSFEIRYVYKKNGGLFTGYLKAIEEADTELMVCIDSDDCMADDGVETILDCWKDKGNNLVAGIRGLNCDKSGNILGDKLPNLNTINLIDVSLGKYHTREADRKDVVRTELYKALLPQDVFENERDMNPSFLLIEISKQYDFLVLNKPLCIVDYQADGMSTTIWKQYLRSPNSFRKLRIQSLNCRNAPFKYKAKETIHYISSSIIAEKSIFRDVPDKVLTFLMLPFGYALSVAVKILGR